MTQSGFKYLSGYEEAQLILAGERKMTKKFAKGFRREQGKYHRAYWSDDGWKLWRMAEKVLGIEEE